MALSPAEQSSEDLEAVLLADDPTASTFLSLLPHPADIVESLRVVEVKEWPRLLRLVQNESMRAHAVALLEESERAALMVMFSPDEIGKLVTTLETDDAVDIIGELDPQGQRAALQSVSAAQRAQLEDLLQFRHDTAGGLMQVERAQVKRDDTVAFAVSKVKELVDRRVRVYAVYIVDDEERLLGIVDLAKLLLQPADKKMGEFMEPAFARVTPDVDQEQVAAIFRKYSSVSIPVVDREGRIVGRILHDDVMHVVAEEAEEDALKQAGTSAQELLFRDRVFPVVRVRLPWLITSLLGSILSATLVFWFQHVIAQAVVLASFIPVITAMGGNVGAQSATIVTRGLTSGRINTAELSWILFRELRVGFVIGAVCGALVAALSVAFFSEGNIALGLVVFGSMLSSITLAAVMGTITPALLKRFGVDPAITSSPFVTVASDVTGILIFLSTALIFLDALK